MNTGGLLERMNFGLALASNKVQGTRVSLSSIVGNDPAKVMSEALRVILGGDVSPTTKEALVKQMDKEAVVSLPAPPSQVEQTREAAPPGEMEGPPVGGLPGGRLQQQRPRVEATINDPVTKVVGLILGTPEFQRQ